MTKKDTTTTENLQELTEVEAELASDLQGHDETVRIARKTTELKTRLNANRCLVLSRYFKLLNAACPNEVEPIWAKLLNLGSDDLIPFGILLKHAEDDLQEEEKVKTNLILARPGKVKCLTDKVTDTDSDDEEDEDHD